MQRILLRGNLFLMLCLFFSFNSFQVSAQNNCPADAPNGYGTEQSGGNCFLTFTWPAGEMPEIACGNPGTPAAGTSAFKGKVIDLELNGTIMVYDNGNNCSGTNYGLAYHPTLANTYITTGSYCAIASAQSTIFRFNRTGGSNFDCTLENFSPILPVELSVFKLNTTGREVILKWSTATEKDNSHFEVEHSSDGRNFSKIGMVMGQGTTFNQNDYEFVDGSPFMGDNYYRLKQMDFNGNASFSPVLSSKIQSTHDLNVTPNKVSSFANVSYTSVQEGLVQLLILDTFGRPVQTIDFFAESGPNQFEVKVDELPNGAYFFTLDDGSRTPLFSRFFKI